MPRPIIGIPCSTSPEPWYSPSYSLPISYLRAVEAAGGVPLLIQPTISDETLDALYARCDGLLLAGGEDIHPSHYGAPPHPKLELTNARRDAVELALARRALADGMPIFGICRGLQLLNVAMGGTLYQDLAAERPEGLEHVAGHVRRDFRFLSHALKLVDDSWLAELLGTTELRVNSLHHQGIRDLAPGLRAAGHAADGLVEVVEARVSGFAVAVQPHPELVWEDADPRWARVFAGFVDRCALR